MKLSINTNNIVTIAGKPVGRLNLTKQGYNRGPKYQAFSTRGGSWTSRDDAIQTDHKIYEPAYIGSGSNWIINPKFITEIEATINV